MIEILCTPATEQDVPAIADVLTDATQHKHAYGDTSWGTEAWSEQEVRDTMKASQVYAVRSAAEILGTFALQWEDPDIWGEQPPTAGYLHRLAIKSSFRGAGIGGQIIPWACGEVQRNGRSLLRLDCDAGNSRLCSYYEKLGFVRVGAKQAAPKTYTAALYELPAWAATT